MVIHDLVFKIGPESDDTFCKAESALSIMAGTAEFSYNCLFCIYIIYVIKNCLY